MAKRSRMTSDLLGKILIQFPKGTLVWSGYEFVSNVELVEIKAGDIETYVSREQREYYEPFTETVENDGETTETEKYKAVKDFTYIRLGI